VLCTALPARLATNQAQQFATKPGRHQPFSNSYPPTSSMSRPTMPAHWTFLAATEVDAPIRTMALGSSPTIGPADEARRRPYATAAERLAVVPLAREA
jgi:hypothetical protein